jgi:arylsulfatase A-like enzyme
MRVPAIFWWPGAIEPAVISDIGSTLDIYVTALSLAGAELPSETDGADLTDALLRGAPSPRDTMAYYRAGELRAFRKGAYKLHLVTQGAYGQPPERTVHTQPVLYHLTSDPSERFDVAARNPQVVADLMQAIDRHRAGMVERPPIFDRRVTGD